VPTADPLAKRLEKEWEEYPVLVMQAVDDRVRIERTRCLIGEESVRRRGESDQSECESDENDGGRRRGDRERPCFRG
jgi:hypothetical protein